MCQYDHNGVAGTVDYHEVMVPLGWFQWRRSVSNFSPRKVLYAAFLPAKSRAKGRPPENAVLHLEVGVPSFSGLIQSDVRQVLFRKFFLLLRNWSPHRLLDPRCTLTGYTEKELTLKADGADRKSVV